MWSTWHILRMQLLVLIMFFPRPAIWVRVQTVEYKIINMEFEAETRPLSERFVSNSRSSCLKPGSKTKSWTRTQTRALAFEITEAIFISYFQINHRELVTDGTRDKVKLGGGGGYLMNLMLFLGHTKVCGSDLALTVCNVLCSRGSEWCKLHQRCALITVLQPMRTNHIFLVLRTELGTKSFCLRTQFSDHTAGITLKIPHTPSPL